MICETTEGLSSSSVRELDRIAAERYGVPRLLLMENAGRVAARAVHEVFERESWSAVWCIAGTSDNGGDACVVARHLHERSVPIFLSFLGDPGASRSEESRLQAGAACRAGLPWALDGHIAAADRRRELPSRTLIVDGIIGLGLSEAPRGVAGSWIESLCWHPSIALDLPSGLDADQGEAPGAVLPARRTVTFGAIKRGLTRGIGPKISGEILVADIGWPRRALEDAGPNLA